MEWLSVVPHFYRFTNAHCCYQVFAFESPGGLGCCPFKCGGFVVFDLLFNVRPIVCGSSVLVFVLLCITLCPF